MKKENQPTDRSNFYGFSKSCEDAMFINPIASANDCTGYTMNAPLTDDEAEDKANLVNAPATKYEIKQLSHHLFLLSGYYIGLCPPFYFILFYTYPKVNCINLTAGASPRPTIRIMW